MLGLEIYDINGNALWSSSDRLARLLGQIMTNAQNGSIYVEGVNFAFFINETPVSGSARQVVPTITINSGTISWVYPTLGGASYSYLNGFIVYGVR